MRTFIGCIAMIASLLSGTALAETIPAYPAGVEARAEHINAKLSPRERVWFKQEAAREAKANIISETLAAQAIRAAGAVDLSKLSIEEAVLMMFMLISEDARNDTRAVLADMEQTRTKKAALRNSEAKKTAVNSSVANNPQLKLVNKNIRLNDPATSKDTLADSGELQQLKLQQYMDRMQKADEAASNQLKKFSDTTSSIIGNMK